MVTTCVTPEVPLTLNTCTFGSKLIWLDANTCCARAWIDGVLLGGSSGASFLICTSLIRVRTLINTLHTHGKQKLLHMTQIDRKAYLYEPWTVADDTDRENNCCMLPAGSLLSSNACSLIPSQSPGFHSWPHSICSLGNCKLIARLTYKLQILMIIMLVISAVLLYISGITSIHVLPQFHLQIRKSKLGSGSSVNMADTENFNQIFWPLKQGYM